MKYWLNIGFLEVEQLAPMAIAAERIGFTGVTLPDHLFFPEQIASSYPYSDDGSVTWSADSPWPDCWVTIGALSQVTTTLQFSTGVFIAPLRDPFNLAKAVGTASLLSGGRVSCGFGTGWLKEEFDVLGVDFGSRGKRFDELLAVLRLLWSGEMVEFHGEHFAFDKIQMCPPAGDVPILIGGNTGPARKRAARNDGWIGSHKSVEETTRLVGLLNEERAAAGRLDVPFEIGVTGGFKAARDAEQLAAVGVEAITVSARALTPSSDLGDRIAALEQLSARFI
ncbi:MAG: TIGR03619 family F420-dependent LLM class oxidoreductase [Acidimicrobiia bacterium]